MKKLWLILFSIVLALTLAIPASAEYQDMWANVYKWTGGYNADGSPGLTRATSGITFKVLQRNSDSSETLYVYGKNTFTSLTNPVTTTLFESSSYCDDQVAFRVDPTDSSYDRYVDLIVTDTNGGYTAFVEDFDKYTHVIVIDERPNVLHHGVIGFTGGSSDGASTGITFNAGTVLRSVMPEFVTALADQSLSVGIGTTTNIFLNQVSSASTGYITVSAASTGSGLGNGTIMYPNGYIFSTASTMTYATSSTAASAPAGYLHYFFSVGR